MLDTPSRGGLPSFGDFLEYLHQQGFYITVDHYARVHALLSRIDLHRHAADLKTLLCPLLVTSVSQQEQFHRAFDAYVDVLRQQRVAHLIAPPRASTSKANRRSRSLGEAGSSPRPFSSCSRPSSFRHY